MSRGDVDRVGCHVAFLIQWVLVVKGSFFEGRLKRFFFTVAAQRAHGRIHGRLGEFSALTIDTKHRALNESYPLTAGIPTFSLNKVRGISRGQITMRSNRCSAFPGYFTVAINPTGSTGYGQDFVTGIQQNWGGRES